MVKVVVVVVVTIREGSRGSGPRLLWENLSEARFRAASSLREEAVTIGLYVSINIDSRQEGIREVAEELPIRLQLE